MQPSDGLFAITRVSEFSTSLLWRLPEQLPRPIAHKRPYRTQELDRSFVFSIVSRLDPNVLHKQPLSRKGASRNLVVDMTRETTQFDELGLVRTASRIAARSLMLVAILVAAYSTAYATTYSVSPPPVGNDANDGSEAAPFATIQKAADVAIAGDTIVVTRGNYAGVLFERSGQTNAPIVLQGQDGAVINSPGPLNTNHAGVYVSRASNIVVEQLEVSGLAGAGIVAVGPLPDNMSPLEGIVIRDNYVHDTMYGGIALSNASGGQVLDNLCTTILGRPGIFVAGLNTTVIIARNVVGDCEFTGICIEGFPTYVTPTTYRVTVEANTVSGCGPLSAAGIELVGADACLVANNLLVDNRGQGFELRMTDGGLLSHSNQLLNNTVYQSGDGGHPIAVRDGSTATTVVNNVLLHPGGLGSIAIDSASLVGLVSDFNDVDAPMLVDATPMSLAEWQGLGFDTNSITALASVVFVDASVGNFEIGPSSPARDSGRNVSGVGHDIRGVARPQGPAFDMGAYEYATDAPPPMNHDPVAEAGPDLTARAGERVDLDGRASSDPDGDQLAFLWEQVSGPPVTLDASTNVTASFVAPSLGSDDDLVFRVTVADGRGGSSADSVTVRLMAREPTIAILKPLAGQVWRIGRMKQIKFVAPTGTAGDVRIELSRDGGASYATIVASVPVSRGKTKWRISGPATSSAILRVVANQSPDVYGVMVQPFTIRD